MGTHSSWWWYYTHHAYYGHTRIHADGMYSIVLVLCILSVSTSYSLAVYMLVCEVGMLIVSVGTVASGWCTACYWTTYTLLLLLFYST